MTKLDRDVQETLAVIRSVRQVREKKQPKSIPQPKPQPTTLACIADAWPK